MICQCTEEYTKKTRLFLYNLLTRSFNTDWIFPYGVRGGAGLAFQAGAFDSEGSWVGVWAMPQTAEPHCAESKKSQLN